LDRLLYLFGGVLLLHLAIGALILLWWFVWSFVRNTKGLLTLNRNEAIANPESWRSSVIRKIVDGVSPTPKTLKVDCHLLRQIASIEWGDLISVVAPE